VVLHKVVRCIYLFIYVGGGGGSCNEEYDFVDWCIVEYECVWNCIKGLLLSFELNINR
jgi:hypothetical protein